MKHLKFSFALILAAVCPPQANALSFNFGPFFVFFDLNSADIRPEGKEVLGFAAKEYVERGEPIGNTIFLAGYTDRSGSEHYNRALADRRTKSVRAFLVTNGVNPDRIVSLPFGEDPNRLRVATDDGAPNDQNRRVEIMFESRGRAPLKGQLGPI
ncbi:MAG: OmpA family protein [Novosphingobium sp.]